MTTRRASRSWPSTSTAARASCSGSPSSPHSPSRSWRPTPRTPTSRACPRSSPATATCRGSSPTAATAWCSPTASSSSPCVAGVLIVVFKGNISALIPLYAVRRVHRVHPQPGRHGRAPLPIREPDWRRRAVINGVGCVATGIVAIVVVVSKFTEGAWIPAVVIPAWWSCFRSIGRHYRPVRRACTVDTRVQAAAAHAPRRRARRVGEPAASSTPLRYARSLAPERLIALSVVTDDEEQQRLLQDVARPRHHDPAADDPVAVPRTHRARCWSISTRSMPRAPMTSSRVIIPEFVTRGRRAGSTTSPPSR